MLKKRRKRSQNNQGATLAPQFLEIEMQFLIQQNLVKNFRSKHKQWPISSLQMKLEVYQKC